MKLFRAFAVASTVLGFLVAVLGSWVRINDAGLTCPDWPLCHGQLVPALRGGVVLEWSHRLVAFVETFLVGGAIVTGWRERSRVAGVTPALGALGVIFALQVSLGGATVFLANNPLSVTLHWAMGMALVATLAALAVLAVVAPQPVRPRAGGGGGKALAVAACCAFATMCLGAYVSSSHAGLACAAFPACGATLLGSGAPQAAQMLHRAAGLVFACAAAYATLGALQNGSPGVKRFALGGFGLLAIQIALGAANVAWQLPSNLRELHAANAGATFLAFVIAARLAALEPQAARERTAERVPASRRIPSSA